MFAVAGACAAAGNASRLGTDGVDGIGVRDDERMQWQRDVDSLFERGNGGNYGWDLYGYGDGNQRKSFGDCAGYGDGELKAGLPGFS